LARLNLSGAINDLLNNSRSIVSVLTTVFHVEVVYARFPQGGYAQRIAAIGSTLAARRAGM